MERISQLKIIIDRSLVLLLFLRLVKHRQNEFLNYLSSKFRRYLIYR